MPARVGFAEVSSCDLICVPGGAGATQVALDAAFVGEVGRLGQNARYVTSVCKGSIILGAAGLLIGRRAACHWAWRELLPLFGAIVDKGRVVQDGNVITGGGVTASIDFVLVVLAEIGGPALAQKIQLGFEYSPAPPFNAGGPGTAPTDIVAAYRAEMAGLAQIRETQAREAESRLGPLQPRLHTRCAAHSILSRPVAVNA